MGRFPLMGIAFLIAIGSAGIATADHFELDEGCAVTPGGWGAPPAGENPGALLHAHFDDVFGEALVVGPEVFEDAQEVTDRIPTESDPLLNHAVALEINLAFGAEGLLDGTLEGVTVDGGEYDGWTAEEILAEAETALADPDRSTAKYSSLIDAMSGLNEERFGCATADGEDCPEGMERNEAGECVTVGDDCPEGMERNEAGECVTVGDDCPEGMERNQAGDCVDVVFACPDFTAEALSDASVRLAWSGGDTPESVEIERDGTVIATVDGDAGMFVDEGLEVGKTYTYVLTAMWAGGASKVCETLEVTAIPFFPGAVGFALAGLGAVGALALARRKA